MQLLSLGDTVWTWASTNGMTFTNPFLWLLLLFAFGGVLAFIPFFSKVRFRRGIGKSKKEMLE